MKTPIVLSASIFFSVVSCNGPSRPIDNKPETPKALQEKTVASDVLSKSRYEDLVESLYEELADKTPALKNLEAEISGIHENQKDSTEAFDKFDQKNQSYFGAAGNHIEQIKDSVLRSKMKWLISGSSEKYNSDILPYKKLFEIINTKTTTLSDLHIVLKITKTLTMIEKYRSDNKPSIKPIEGFINDVDKTIKSTDSLIKK